MSPPALLKSVRTGAYQAMLTRLPIHIQEKCDKLWVVFQKDPHDPILENEELYDSKKGRHRSGSHSVAITRRYRAIYVVDKGPDGTEESQYCWYWVGSHEDYNNFVASKKK